MKLTKATLKQLIQEELQAVLAETLSAEKQAKLKKLKKKKNKSKEEKDRVRTNSFKKQVDFYGRASSMLYPKIVRKANEDAASYRTRLNKAKDKVKTKKLQREGL